MNSLILHCLIGWARIRTAGGFKNRQRLFLLYINIYLFDAVNTVSSAIYIIGEIFGKSMLNTINSGTICAFFHPNPGGYKNRHYLAARSHIQPQVTNRTRTLCEKKIHALWSTPIGRLGVKFAPPQKKKNGAIKR